MVSDTGLWGEDNARTRSRPRYTYTFRHALATPRRRCLTPVAGTSPQCQAPSPRTAHHRLDPSPRTRVIAARAKWRRTRVRLLAAAVDGDRHRVQQDLVRGVGQLGFETLDDLRRARCGRE